ncbi:hypothetical protein CR513_53146, partial [Mucuna pruriens]
MESTYEQEFPSLERKVDPVTKITTKPNISFLEIGPDGRSKPLSQAEDVLNWQTKNAKVQNSILKKIDERMEKISSRLEKSDEKLDLLLDKMRRYYHQLMANIYRLEVEWKNTRKMKERQDLPPDPYAFIPSSLPIYQTPFQQPSSSLFSSPQKTWTLPTATAYRTRTKPETKPESSSGVYIPKTSKQSPKDSPKSSPERPPLSSLEKQTICKKDDFQDSQDPYNQFTIKLCSSDESRYDNSSDTEDTQLESSSEISEEDKDYDQPESSSKNSEENKDYVDLSNILMSTTTGSVDGTEAIYDSLDDEVISSPPLSSASKPNYEPWFTLDDIPPSRWRRRLIEFGAWLDTRLMKDPDSYKVIEEFFCRMTGTLKEWYYNLGVFHQLETSAAVLGALHKEFIGDGAIIDRKIRQEYFKMRCCSIRMKDLDKHFQRMSQRFYMLNDPNDPNLKNTYVASLPLEIQPEFNRMAMIAHKDFSAMTMGQIHQMTQEVIDKLCRQHQYFSNVMNQKGKFNKACKKSYLEIKCKDKTCSCSPKKKKREVQPLKKKKRSFKFFKKKNVFHLWKEGTLFKKLSQQSRQSNQTHFFLKALKLGDEEVESLYSEQSLADEETVFALKESEDEYQSETDSIPIFSVEELNKVQLLSSKFQKPIKVIAYMDIGAQKTKMNPDILPKEFWKKDICYFVAADRKVFRTDLITKDPVGIRFFLECVVWSKVIGSKLPNIDILIGMDVYSAANKLQILSTGVKYKREFKPFTEVMKLFSITKAHADIEEIKRKMFHLCANNHEEFTHPNPIWKNPDFFIRLPFKLNEDVNPTKATHPGMTSSDLLLARQECHELLRQGLIEPIQSNWACQAFYVEKRSKKLRGKKRLVIDYKPLNYFLKDDKFPIPKASSLPILLKESNIFSKFDLKSGFWQLGINPADRHKTAFCIPNA